MLADLKASGYRLGVLTDNPPKSQAAKLRVCGLDATFDAVVYSREVGAEKPDSRAFMKAASDLRVAPERLAMVGDNPYRDLLGALTTGYSLAFWLARSGGLLNVHAEIFHELIDTSAQARIRRIDDLRQLRWYLCKDGQV